MDKKKIDCKISSGNTKESKKSTSEQTLELDEVKAEDGVLTFYLELQENKYVDRTISDSEDDDE